MFKLRQILTKRAVASLYAAPDHSVGGCMDIASGTLSQLSRTTSLLGFAALVVSMLVFFEALKALGWDNARDANRRKLIRTPRQ